MNLLDLSSDAADASVELELLAQGLSWESDSVRRLIVTLRNSVSESNGYVDPAAIVIIYQALEPLRLLSVSSTIADLIREVRTLISELESTLSSACPTELAYHLRDVATKLSLVSSTYHSRNGL